MCNFNRFVFSVVFVFVLNHFGALRKYINPGGRSTTSIYFLDIVVLENGPKVLAQRNLGVHKCIVCVNFIGEMFIVYKLSYIKGDFCYFDLVYLWNELCSYRFLYGVLIFKFRLFLPLHSNNFLFRLISTAGLSFTLLHVHSPYFYTSSTIEIFK